MFIADFEHWVRCSVLFEQKLRAVQLAYWTTHN